MKKLLWCAAGVGTFAVIIVIVLLRNPNNAILGVSHRFGPQYEEIIVLKRDRTYEQLLRRKSNGAIIIHSGAWIPAQEDVKSRLFAAQTGTPLRAGAINYKEMLIANDKRGTLQKMDMMLESPAGIRPPDEKTLSLWQEWRARARPFNATDSAAHPNHN